MPALPVLAGGRILAGVIASVAPLCVIKGADESLTSSVTMQNDDALFLPVVANAAYMFDTYLLYEAASAINTGGIAWQWAVPASATLRYQGVYTRGTDGGNITGSSFTGATVVKGIGQGAGGLCGASMTGSLITSGTAGTIQLQWAQGFSNATATIVHAQSFLTLWRVS